MIARQLPDRGEIFLDHLAHFVPSLDCAAAVLEKLGFRLTPFAAQRNRTPNGNEPSGMANRCVMLREGYLERSEEHTSELQSLMRISYAVFCLKKKTKTHKQNHRHQQRKQQQHGKHHT